MSGSRRDSSVEAVLLMREPSAPSARFAIGSPYVERFYLPSIGPTSMALLRFCDEFLTVCGDRPTQLPAGELGQSVGASGPVAGGSLNRLGELLFLPIQREGAVLAIGVPAALPIVREALRRRWSPTIEAIHSAGAFRSFPEDRVPA